MKPYIVTVWGKQVFVGDGSGGVVTAVVRFKRRWQAELFLKWLKWRPKHRDIVVLSTMLTRDTATKEPQK